LLAIGLGYFIIKNRLQSNSDRKELLLTGVTEPAIILAAHNNYSSSGSRNSPATRVNVSFEVEVQPSEQPPFKASFRDWLFLKNGERFWPGERFGDAGLKVWVTYDPQNPKRMVLVIHRIGSK
jgi:hypothetical protein